MAATVSQVRRGITNALSDLYRIDRHSTGMTPTQKNAVKDAIRALEDEYIELRASPELQTYSAITAGIKAAMEDLTLIKNERDALRNAFTSAAKILGSITRLLALLA